MQILGIIFLIVVAITVWEVITIIRGKEDNYPCSIIIPILFVSVLMCVEGCVFCSGWANSAPTDDT